MDRCTHTETVGFKHNFGVSRLYIQTSEISPLKPTSLLSTIFNKCVHLRKLEVKGRERTYFFPFI